MGNADTKAQIRKSARRLALGLFMLLALLAGLWVVLDNSEEPAADDWELIAVAMGDGDPDAVVARPGAAGWEIDVAISGGVPVSAKCPEPRMASIVVDDDPATAVLLMQWPSRGCETGPKQFTVRLTTLVPPFRVVIKGEYCRDVTVDG
ncbi:MAG: hypothetical protein ABMA25_21760, partial [Ilumatobacteraceae bacterium]